MAINNIMHPDYAANIALWIKYRLTFEGGDDFITKYLKQFSVREDGTDYANRKAITYCPAHAKAAVIDIKNAIYQRMVDITRKGGTTSYQEAIDGRNAGVDLNGNTMTGFVGRLVLPELLSMSKVGVYVDRSQLSDAPTKHETANKSPYLYVYKTEDIRSWSYNRNNELKSVLLKDHDFAYDDDTGLPTETVVRYRLLQLTDEGKVSIQFYNSMGEVEGEETILNLNKIPFVIFEITSSLLTDVADYQISLLNLGSSDMNYAMKSNFPFYVEQFDIRSEMAGLIPQNTTVNEDTGVVNEEGTADEADKAKRNNLDIGAAQGRKYPIGAEKPAFIHPSSAPLIASMKKQAELRQEIRQLVNLAVVDVEPRNASAESKQEDEKSLEAGLSYIGLELEYGERQIAEIWSSYEHSPDTPTISYPQSYTLKSDESRRIEAKEATALLPVLPSLTYQKEVAKEIAKIIIGHKISTEDLEKIFDEIDSAKVIVMDPEIIRLDHEAGFIGTKLSSELRGYPEGEVELAKADHAERAIRVLAAQSNGMGARGVNDLSVSPDDAAKEKKDSRNPDDKAELGDKTRGKGK